MKKKISHYITLSLFFLLNILRVAPLFIFDYYREIVDIIIVIMSLIVMIFIIIFIVPIILSYPVFKEMNYSFSDVFIVKKGDYNTILYVTIIITLLLSLFFVASDFIMTSVNGGHPEVKDASYYIVAHGEIIEEISYEKYKLYKLLDQQNSISILAMLVFFINNYIGNFSDLIEYAKHNMKKCIDESNIKSMQFNYLHYRIQLLVLPVVYLLIISFSTIVIIFFIETMIKGTSTIIVLIIILIISILMVIRTVSLLKYGIYMLAEKKSDVAKITGVICDIKIIKNPFPHVYPLLSKTYKGFPNWAYSLSIDGKKFYIMSSGPFKIGNNVELAYMAKSRVVILITKNS